MRRRVKRNENKADVSQTNGYSSNVDTKRGVGVKGEESTVAMTRKLGKMASATTASFDNLNFSFIADSIDQPLLEADDPRTQTPHTPTRINGTDATSSFLSEENILRRSNKHLGSLTPSRSSLRMLSSRRVVFDSLTTDSASPISRGAISRRTSVVPLQDFSLQYHASVIVFESFNLASFLFHGTPRWIAKLVRLMCFVFALFPAFLVFFTFYVITSDRIACAYKEKHPHKVFSRTSRHYLDIYGSTTTISGKRKKLKIEEEPLKPVVIFLTGGAWIIGYKMWGALLARALVPFGIMVVIPDYRNFPQTNVEGMIDDADWAVDWTLKNCHKYGGDPNKVVLAGQSAGAHIGACLMIRKAKLPEPENLLISTELQNNSHPKTSWHALDIKGYIAVSGPYDLVAMQSILHEHGLDKTIVSAMFRNKLAEYSPTVTLRELATSKGKENHLRNDDEIMRQRIKTQFPPTCVIHGEVDKTVPFQISIEFYEALKKLDLEQPLEFKLYPSWSHTDPILEAPFAGNHLFHRDVYDLVQQWTSICNDNSTIKEEEENILENSEQTSSLEGANNEGIECLNTERVDLLPFDESHLACKKICPLFLVRVARFCNPF